jgi:hypothetical protein
MPRSRCKPIRRVKVPKAPNPKLQVPNKFPIDEIPKSYQATALSLGGSGFAWVLEIGDLEL